MVAATVVGLTAPNPLVPAALILAIWGTAWAADLNLRAFRLLLIAIAILAVPVLVIQLLVQSTGSPLVLVGPFAVNSGALLTSLLVVLRLLCLSSAFVELVLWTHPMELAQVLVKAGLGYRYAMLFGLALRFFPVLEQELAAIMDAQAARGLENRGFWNRGAGLLYVLVPFCLRSIRRSGEVALAMELRGYGYAPTRTFLRQVAFRRADGVLTAIIVAAFLGYWAIRL